MKSWRNSASARAGAARSHSSSVSLPFPCINHARVPWHTLPLREWATLYRKLWGKDASYQLGLLLASREEGRCLNQRYRGSQYVPEVLAFPLSPDVGDIVIVPSRAREMAPSFSLSFKAMLVFLFAHAALHLQGYHHGSAMEQRERELLQQLAISPPHLHHKAS